MIYKLSEKERQEFSKDIYNFVLELNNFSDKKRDSVVIPNLIYIKEGKVDKVLNTSETKMNKRDVRNFLIKCGVITND